MRVKKTDTLLPLYRPNLFDWIRDFVLRVGPFKMVFAVFSIAMLYVVVGIPLLLYQALLLQSITVGEYCIAILLVNLFLFVILGYIFWFLDVWLGELQ